MRQNRLSSFTALCATLCLFLGVPGFSLAAQLTPGTVERQFDKRPEPRSTDTITLPRPALQQPPEMQDEYNFTLTSLTIQGGTVYAEDDLRPYFQEFIGQDISVQTLFAIAGRITNRYADDGYALSLAYVPAQEIGAAGTARLVIVEGYIGEVSYTGEVEYLSDRAKRLMEAIVAERPLTVATLERQLLLANDLPGLALVSTIDRSALEVGAAALVVEVFGKEFGFSMGTNNRGSKAQGPWRGSLGAKANNLLFEGSSLGFQAQRTYHAEEMRYYALDYGLILSDSGLRLDLLASLSRSEPDVALLQELEYETWSENYSVGLVYPFLRSRRQNLEGLLRLEIKESDSEFFGVTYSEEKTRILRVGTTYDWIDGTGATNLVQLVVSQGLDIFGATDNDSAMKVRAVADYTFTAVRFDASRNQPISQRLSLFFTTTAQYTSDPLAPSEQIGWGGELSGRAYDSFELSGDHGLFAGIELRQTWNTPIATINYIQPYLFLEGAKLWTEPNDVLGRGTESVTEYDYGLGVRGQVDRIHYFYMELAVPGDRDVAQEGDDELRVFAGWQMVY